VAVKIRLKRMGKIRAPHYRIVVADARTKRDGRVIEEIGKYHPKEDPSFIEVNAERAQYWLSVGAQASEPVTAILKVTGDWQTFKGEAAPPPMKVAEPKRDKTELFNEALKDSTSEPKADAVTAKKTTAKKSAAPVEAPSEEAKATEDTAAAVAVSGQAPTSETPSEAAADAPASDAPASDAPASDAPASDAPASDAPASDAPAGAETSDASDTPAEAPASDAPAADDKTED
jgi:small subunit ribosomal protein S16